jgi:hypothetical protein
LIKVSSRRGFSVGVAPSGVTISFRPPQALQAHWDAEGQRVKF